MGAPQIHVSTIRLSQGTAKTYRKDEHFTLFHFKLAGYLAMRKGKFLKTFLMDSHLFSFHERFSRTRFPFTVVKKTFLGACLWMMLLGGCVSHPFAHLEEWKEVRTSHFIFYSNAEEDVALEIAHNLENFRTIALKMTDIPPFQDPSLRVYVFKNENSFTPFKPTEDYAGFFIPGPNYIAMNASAWKLSASSIIYHEFIHYLLSKHPARFPRWYDEGLAGLFETLEYQDGTVKFGIPPSDMWLWLNNLPAWIPMEQLLWDQVDFTQHQGLTNGHAQSWAIMHYFFFGKEENFLKLGRYIFLVNNGMQPPMALMEACGLTPEGLLKEVKEYIAQDTINYSTMPLTQFNKPSNYQVLPITQVEAKRVLQDLLVLIKK